MQADSLTMAEPRYQTLVDTEASWLSDFIQEAESMGYELMEWQLKAAALICALNTDGSPRYKEIVITVPRQSGKTVLMRVYLHAIAKREKMQRLYITAQTRIDALKHLENLGRDIHEDVKVRLSVGTERITWKNGTTLELIAPTPGGGHGVSIDKMVLDEVWDLQPHVMAGIIPAMSARPHSQAVYISTMGTVASEVFNGLVARGREAVADSSASFAYLEYSAPSDADVFSEEKWCEWMPALGHTQSFESIRSAKDALPMNEFIRAFGNRVTVTLSRVFPSEWVDDSWRIIEPPNKFVLAVDVNDEPAGTSISTAHMTTDGVAVRNVEWRYGTPKWVVAYVEHLLDLRSVEAVVGDFGGPARQLHEELSVLCDAKRVPLVDRKPRDLAADTLYLFDGLRERTVQLTKTEPLADAFNGAEKRPLGDMWLVSRNRMTVDASPLISAILAAGLAKELSVKPKVLPAIY